MAKFSHNQLSPQEKERLFNDFVLALSAIQDPEESAAFIRDLFSQQEVEMLARRIKIAELLLDGLTYQEIQDTIKVSQTTIARVGEWLKQSGSGYRIVVERLKKKRNKDTTSVYTREPTEWQKLKRRYPMMFWPQLVIDEIVASASKRQKKRLQSVLHEMDEKSELYKKLNTAMR